MQMIQKSDLVRRISDAATMFIVSLFCVLLLIYIAYGTTKRTYEHLLAEKAMAQATLIRSPIENYLRPGLSLRQFAGFNQLTTSMVVGDATLRSIVVELGDGELVFSKGDVTGRTLPPNATPVLLSDVAEFRSSADELQIILPLRNKFEQVGKLIMTMDRAIIDQRLTSQFDIAIIVALLACLAFGIVVFQTAGKTTGSNSKPVAVAFTGVFLLVSIVVVASMISLFTAGAESKGRALIDSLSQRFDDIPMDGLQFDQIDGLDAVLDSYRLLNREISSIGITINGRVAVATDRSKIGGVWTSSPGQTDYKAWIRPPDHPRAAVVVLSVPKNVVIWQVASNIKNYAALFVASALFAFLFLQLAQSIRAAQAVGRASVSDWRSGIALELVKPVFFMAVFVDNLSYAFLPQFLSGLAARGGETAGAAAWPFTAYYLCFALALIPAGHLGRSVGSRNLVLAGLGMIGIGLASMIFVTTLPMAVVARGITGLGQGSLFIGVQSFILTMAHREHRTRANGIIVFGFQGGMISGMAIGSLLAGEIGAEGVFAVAATMAAAAILYTFAIVPGDSRTQKAELQGPSGSKVTWTETVRLLHDAHFMRIILLVGIPAKAVLTGVVLFAMPLLLDGMGFAKEDIGQITMIYACCVLASSAIAARLADRAQSCRNLLVWGAFLTAAGLFVISLSGCDFVNTSAHPLLLKTVVAILGLAIIGGAHGMINAPVVTYISDTEVAERIGQGPTAAAYRFLERAGHMLGPIAVGQLFLTFGTSPLVLGWIGAFMAGLAAAFHLINPGKSINSRNEEFA